MTENEISFQIRAAIFDVYNKLGAGLYEFVYEKALSIKLMKRGLDAKSQVGFEAVYDDIVIGEAFKLDLLVNNKVIIELKSVEKLQLVHHKQLITYLKLTGFKLGILVNFNCSDLKDNIIRKANGL
ncbi:MAG TPA: GxxExxY protein [Candidatus Cloacimonadota bacterium]|nr:GxxExxY protein [Candidatus Cloacimonadota bacterium]